MQPPKNKGERRANNGDGIVILVYPEILNYLAKITTDDR